uniref:RING-type E3 ubiquitin transferase n=1 Tax=Davidia involucrata TaxID=16924 RepID=A0A5B6YJ20_DAVIN
MNNSDNDDDDVLDLLDDSLNCSFCMQIPERPVTTPCGHNFCLRCFQKWVGQGKHTCANCRNAIPPKMASQPRINSALVIAIRMAKMSKAVAAGGLPKVYHFVHNQNRPDKAYTTERAKRAGKANACSGKIFVTVPPDHYGPILAENDPERKQGVLVGESWEDRMECRQWGAHLPHVAGIAGQSEYGAQSVALSGGYEDDEDHGEWFLYTGSGGRDLSGNKRTNKTQSFDQKFEKLNEALRVSCRKGYPVRVVRSHKEKRSSYAPETGVRYDGIYRIEKCWRKVGIQGFKVCRYLFVRCDNDPAPWTSDERGDCPRPFPVIKELKNATDITERKGTPSWDYDEEKGCWMWKNSPPQSRKQANSGNLEDGRGATKVRHQTQTMSVRERLLKEFSCLICRKVMISPLTTPCAHNFCKVCLEGAFSGQTFIRQRTCEGRRTLRAQKNVMKCPSCSNDISDFLQNPQVNRELMGVIESLQRQTKKMEENVESSEETDGTDKKSDMVAAEIEISDMNSEIGILEEDKEGILNPPTKVKPQQTYRRMKESGGDLLSEEKLVEKPDAVNGDIEISPVKPQMSDNKEVQATFVDDKVKRTFKRKKADDGICSSTLDAGVKTRSKKAKPVADDNDFA